MGHPRCGKGGSSPPDRASAAEGERMEGCGHKPTRQPPVQGHAGGAGMGMWDVSGTGVAQQQWLSVSSGTVPW